MKFEDEIQEELAQLKNDPHMKSLPALKMMIKSYTSEALFRNIGKNLSLGKFAEIQIYLNALLTS